MSDGELQARLTALEARVAALEGQLTGEAEERLASLALQSIWAHLDERGLEGFPERIVNDLVDLTGTKPVDLSIDIDDLAHRLTRIETKVGTVSEGSASDSSVIRLTGSYDRRFLALARQVKTLKDTVQQLAEESAAARQHANAEALRLLRSDEFKQLFNRKMQGVLQLLKTEIVPKSVEKQLKDQEV